MTEHQHESDESRYVALQLNDSEVMVYDVNVETAWIQSDVSVDMDKMA